MRKQSKILEDNVCITGITKLFTVWAKHPLFVRLYKMLTSYASWQTDNNVSISLAGAKEKEILGINLLLLPEYYRIKIAGFSTHGRASPGITLSNGRPTKQTARWVLKILTICHIVCMLYWLQEYGVQLSTANQVDSCYRLAPNYVFTHAIFWESDLLAFPGDLQLFYLDIIIIVGIISGCIIGSNPDWTIKI
jgi:hypothetical protein